MVFFAVILGVFSSLWRAAGESGLMAAAAPRTLLWYLAATEWILMSTPLLHLEIQEAVRRGDVVYQLGRPISYVGAAFAEGVGLLAARAPVLGVVAFLCAFAFTGWIPPLRVLALIAAFGLVGVGAAHGARCRHRPAGVLARRCGAGVLGVAEAAVRVRRADAADSAVSVDHSTHRGVDAVPLDSRGPGVVRPRRSGGGARPARDSSRGVGRRHGVVVGFMFRRASHALAVNGG